MHSHSQIIYFSFRFDLHVLEEYMCVVAKYTRNNALFKALVTFPLRYLFAIGLVPVFSFRWSLPPTLGCIPKQPDSDTPTPATP